MVIEEAPVGAHPKVPHELKPGHVFVTLDEEIENFKTEAGLFRKDEDGHELFYVTPYLAAYARNMLRNPICQNLPRKWKTAFSCGPTDCAGTPFHDMGFIAKIKKENGKEIRGFEVVVGGGLSTMPRKA